MVVRKKIARSILSKGDFMNELNLTKYEILLLYNALDIEIKRLEKYFAECLAKGLQFYTGNLESDIKDLKEILEKLKNYIDANREELP